MKLTLPLRRLHTKIQNDPNIYATLENPEIITPNRKRSKTLKINEFAARLRDENICNHTPNSLRTTAKLTARRYIEQLYTTKNTSPLSTLQPPQTRPRHRNRTRQSTGPRFSSAQRCSPWMQNNYYDREEVSKRRQLRFSYDDTLEPRDLPKEETLELNFRRFLQAPDQSLDQIRRSRTWITHQLATRYNTRISQLLASFLELPMYLEFTQWKNIIQKLVKLHHEGQIVLLFRIFDSNNDKFVSSSDIFKVQVSIRNEMEAVNEDVKTIMDFVQNKLNLETVDEEEYYFLKKSYIYKDELTLTEMITWTEVYQNDQTQEQRLKKGLNYQRQFPFQSFIGSHHYFGEDDCYTNEKQFLDKFPLQYKHRDAFSLNYPLFRRAFLGKCCRLWSDIANFISGLP